MRQTIKECAKDVKVTFALSQVLDQELRLFRDLKILKDGFNLNQNSHLCSLIKALKCIDTKNKEGIDCTGVKTFLNRNIVSFEFTTKDV